MPGWIRALSNQRLAMRRRHCNRFRDTTCFLLLLVCVAQGNPAPSAPTLSPTVANQIPYLWVDDDDGIILNVTNTSLAVTETPSQGPTTAATPVPTASSTTLSPTREIRVNPANSSFILTDSPTPLPIRAATGVPTATPTTPNPSKDPSPNPTPAPTKLPSKNPTASPSLLPTPAPSPLPSKMPTKSPTGAPSQLPTRNPTKSPTRRPSMMPTAAPSPSPTVKDSSRPTASPSRSPTNRPTRSPTKVPSRNPSDSPTGKPSVSPTREDSSLPTPSPSLFPTGIPSVAPTPNPTATPSIAPTAQSAVPTQLPSVVPTTSQVPSGAPTTPSPSAAPSLNPTKQPTKQPSRIPTSAPSLSPSLPLQSDLIVAFMTLAPYLYTAELEGTPAIVWERVTRQFITAQIGAMDVDPELFEVTVDADIRTQVPPREAGGGRMLQNTRFANNSLIIEFNVAISYRSTGNEHDLDELVFSAWDAPDEKAAYVNRLKAQSSYYGAIEEVNVEVEGFIPKTPDPKDPEDEGLGIAAIAGGAGGAVLLILICGFLYVRNQNQKEEEAQYDRSKATSAGGPRIAAEIQVETQDEVSTLGDPMFAPGGMLIGSLEKDEGTATVGDDYDYTRQYRQQRNESSVNGERSRMMSEDYTKSSSVNSTTMMSKLGRMGESLFADDASFEQQFAQPEERFDVVAPAGKLGMVIDTPNGGSPVVHAIKDTSVLSDRVRVGDRLLSVDGDDCTAMTAMQVSKLISLKSEKPARVLVFARSSSTSPAD